MDWNIIIWLTVSSFLGAAIGQVFGWHLAKRTYFNKGMTAAFNMMGQDIGTWTVRRGDD